MATGRNKGQPRTSGQTLQSGDAHDDHVDAESCDIDRIVDALLAPKYLDRLSEKLGVKIASLIGV